MLNLSDKKRVKDIVSLLTVEQKLSQMFVVGFYGMDVDRELLDWVNNHLGGIVFFADNIESPLQVSKYIRNFQILSPIGLFISVDQEGGLVERIRGVAQVPAAMALAAAEDEEIIASASHIIAKQLSLLGFNLNFAPVLDVNLNPKNKVIGTRAFGDKPNKVAQLAMRVIELMTWNNIIPAAKHFPGHGATIEDSHEVLPKVSIPYDDLCRDHFYPFQEAISNDIDMIMVGHMSNTSLTGKYGIPTSLAEDVVTDLLKNKMMFDGVVITDDMNMKAITDTFPTEEAAYRAFTAGVDLLLYRNYKDAFIAYQYLIKQYKEEKISEKRIDESLTKLITLKLKYTIFKTDYYVEDTTIEDEIGKGYGDPHVQELFDKTLTLYKSCIIDQDASKLIVSVDREKLPRYKSEPEINLSSFMDDIDEVKISINPTEEEIQKVNELVNNYDKLIVISYDAYFNEAQANFINQLIAKKDTYLLAAGSPYDASLFVDASLVALSYGYANGAIISFSKLLKNELVPNKNLPVNIPL